jgi:hypothetical protein
MRAPITYLSADQLGISEQENTALAEVQRRLETGELPWHPYQSFNYPLVGDHFNMASSYFAGYCGTVACIGGWMAVLMGHENPPQYVTESIFNANLSYLFTPDPHNVWHKITAVQAAYAIKRFRQHGDPRTAWYEALNQ